MTVCCRSKEGKEIIDVFMSYVTIETLSEDRCLYAENKYDDLEDTIFIIRFRSSKVNDNLNPETFYDMTLILNESFDRFAYCKMTIVLDIIKINQKLIKKELSKIDIEN